MKYLEKNCYGLNPKQAEYITGMIHGDELKDQYIKLKVETGFIDGQVNDSDVTYPIKDTIKVIYENKEICELNINSDELDVPLKYGFETTDFIMVKCRVFKDENFPMQQYFIKALNKISLEKNGIGQDVFPFLILLSADEEKAKDIIVNKLRDIILKSMELMNAEADEYVLNIRRKYLNYID